MTILATTHELIDQCDFYLERLSSINRCPKKSIFCKNNMNVTIINGHGRLIELIDQLFAKLPFISSYSTSILACKTFKLMDEAQQFTCKMKDELKIQKSKDKAYKLFKKIYLNINVALKSHQNDLETIKQKLKKDILQTLKKPDPVLIAYYSDLFREDPNVMLALLKLDGSFYLQLSPQLQQNAYFAFIAIINNADMVDHLNPSLASDNEFLIYLLNYNGLFLNRIQSHYRNDPSLVSTAIKQNGLAFEFASLDLKNDPNIAKIAIRQNRAAAAYLGESLLNDRAFIISILQEDGLTLRYLPMQLRENAQYVIIAIKQNKKASIAIGRLLRNNAEFYLHLIQDDLSMLVRASEKMKSNKTFMLNCLKYHTEAFIYVDKKLRTNLSFLQAAYLQDSKVLQFYTIDEIKKLIPIESSIFEDLSESYYSNKEVVLLALQQNGLFYHLLSTNLKKDRELILTAIKQNGSVFHMLENKFKNDYEIIQEAIKSDFSVFEYIDKRFKNDKNIIMSALECTWQAITIAGSRVEEDREVVLFAVSKNGMALSYLPAQWHRDKEIMMRAILTYPQALLLDLDYFLNDKEVIVEALRRNGLLYGILPDWLKKDLEIIKAALEQNGIVLSYLSNDLRDNEELVLLAINNNPMALKFASIRLRRDKQIVLFALNKNIQAKNGIEIDLFTDEDFCKQYIDLLMTAIRNSRDATWIFQEVDALLSHLVYFNINDHQIYDELWLYKICTFPELLADCNNPYIVYQNLQLNETKPLFELPFIRSARVNCEGIQKLSQNKTIYLEEIKKIFGNHLSMMNLAYFQNLRKKIEDKLKRREDLSWISYMEFEPIAAKFFTDTWILSLFNTFMSQKEIPLSVVEAQFFQLMHFLILQSENTLSSSLFSLQEDLFIRMLLSIQNCKTGKMQAIASYYAFIQEEYGVYSPQFTSSENPLLADFLYQTICDLLSQSHILKDLLEIEDEVELSQQAHFIVFFKNILLKRLGFNHELLFDPHTQVLWDELPFNLASQTIEPYANFISRHFTPQLLISKLQQKCNDLQLKQNKLMQILDEIYEEKNQLDEEGDLFEINEQIRALGKIDPQQNPREFIANNQKKRALVEKKRELQLMNIQFMDLMHRETAVENELHSVTQLLTKWGFADHEYNAEKLLIQYQVIETV